MVIWEGYEAIESILSLLMKGELACRGDLERGTSTRACLACFEEVFLKPTLFRVGEYFDSEILFCNLKDCQLDRIASYSRQGIVEVL